MSRPSRKTGGMSAMLSIGAPWFWSACFDSTGRLHLSCRASQRSTYMSPGPRPTVPGLLLAVILAPHVPESLRPYPDQQSVRVGVDLLASRHGTVEAHGPCVDLSPHRHASAAHLVACHADAG